MTANSSSASAPSTDASQSVSTTYAEELLLAAEDCCNALLLVQHTYHLLERFNFLDMVMSLDEVSIDRKELGALLARVNEAATRQIDITLTSVRRARANAALSASVRR